MFFLLFFTFSSCYLGNLSVVSLKSINSPLFRTASPFFVIHSSRMSQAIPFQLHFSNFMITKSFCTLLSSSNIYGQQISLINSHFQQFLQRPFYLAQYYNTLYNGTDNKEMETILNQFNVTEKFDFINLRQVPPEGNMEVINCTFRDLYPQFSENRDVYIYGGAFFISVRKENPNFNVEMKNTTFENCHAKYMGGAVFVENAKSAKFTDCQFQNCTVTCPNNTELDAYGNAISIFNVAEVDLLYCRFNNNSAEPQFSNINSSFTLFFHFVEEYKLNIIECSFNTSTDTPGDSLEFRPTNTTSAKHANAQIGISSSQPIQSSQRQIFIYRCCFFGQLPPITYLTAIGDELYLSNNYYNNNSIYYEATKDRTDANALSTCPHSFTNSFTDSEVFSYSEVFSETSDFSPSNSSSFTSPLSYSSSISSSISSSNSSSFSFSFTFSSFTFSSNFSLSSDFSPTRTSQPTTDYQDIPTTKKLSTGAIIGIVAAILALIIIIVIILYCFVNIKKKAFIPPIEDPMNIDGLDVPFD